MKPQADPPRYDWRYFEGPRSGDIVKLTLHEYAERLAVDEPLALVLGQTIPDRNPGDKP